MTDIDAVLALPRRAGDPRTFTAEEWGEVNGYNAALDEVKLLLRRPGTQPPKVSVEVWDGEDQYDATVADVVRINDTWHVVVTVDGT